MLGIFDPDMDNLLALVSYLVYIFTLTTPPFFLLSSSPSSVIHKFTTILAYPRNISLHFNKL